MERCLCPVPLVVVRTPAEPSEREDHPEREVPIPIKQTCTKLMGSSRQYTSRDRKSVV